MIADIQRRADELELWLANEAPYIVADQKHLDEHSTERAYWHYGYRAALLDVLEKLKPAEPRDGGKS